MVAQKSPDAHFDDKWKPVGKWDLGAIGSEARFECRHCRSSNDNFLDKRDKNIGCGCGYLVAILLLWWVAVYFFFPKVLFQLMM